MSPQEQEQGPGPGPGRALRGSAYALVRSMRFADAHLIGKEGVVCRRQPSLSDTPSLHGASYRQAWRYPRTCPVGALWITLTLALAAAAIVEPLLATERASLPVRYATTCTVCALQGVAGRNARSLAHQVEIGLLHLLEGGGA